ncbi:hypothetical protein ACIHDR_48170 [Nocardia sp. NPDC052278]|uniref:hypothetical protein n=1 Tax=unclassified Nocardia TaxID=2637762 RepID=UPI00367D8A84
MSRSVVVCYQTRPESAAENKRLVEAVFAELAEAKPDGLSYLTFQLSDGVTFVHIAIEEPDIPVLPELAAFQEFTRDITARAVQQPTPTAATLVGSYRFSVGPAGHQ